MRVSLCQLQRGVLWAKNIFICVSGLWPGRPEWKKRSRPPLRSPILLSTRVTCQLMWPSWDVNRSGKNQMFSFTSGASTLFFSRRWQANMSRYWPGTPGPPGGVTHSELGFRKHQNITLCKTEGRPDLRVEYRRSFKEKHRKIASISDVFVTKSSTQRQSEG